MTGYKILRGGAYVGTTTSGTTYADTSLTASTTYTYTVKAYDAAGNVSTASNIAPSTTGTWADGFAAAPAGIVQHPTLLQGYAARAPWRVAGVDYAVGVPATTTLTDWQSLSGAGITVNTSSNDVRVDNTSGVTFNGVDFSLHGGAYLFFVNSPNGKVLNSKFGGSNLTTIPSAVIAADSASPGLTVEYNTIDGAGAGSGSGLVLVNGSGTTTMEYNWFKNFPSQVLEENQAAGLTFSIVYKYNFIEQGAQGAGAHMNYLQFISGTSTSADIEFNASYQNPPPTGTNPGEGYQFYDNGTGGAIQNVTLTYNTIIATGTTTAMSAMIHAGGSQNAGIGHDNYMDLTAASFPFYPGSFTGWTLSNNYDMTTGAALTTNP